jgi:hypothetical protein
MLAYSASPEISAKIELWTPTILGTFSQIDSAGSCPLASTSPTPTTACSGTPPTRGRFPGQTGDHRVGQTGVRVRDNFDLWGQTVEERILHACVQALNDLQDYIDEATHDPWPGDSSPPRPYAEIRDARVILGYGTPGATVIVCEPIPLDGI